MADDHISGGRLSTNRDVNIGRYASPATPATWRCALGVEASKQHANGGDAMRQLAASGSDYKRNNAAGSDHIGRDGRASTTFRGK